MDSPLRAALISSSQKSIECNLHTGKYQVEQANGQPYLVNGNYKVIGIFNTEVGEENHTAANIKLAQDFYMELPEATKTLAQRTLTVTTTNERMIHIPNSPSYNPLEGARQPSRHTRERLHLITTHDAPLTEEQCKSLKALFENTTDGAFFNDEIRAITSFDEQLYFQPDSSGRFTPSHPDKELLNYEAIKKQYSQWDEKASTATQPCFYSQTAASSTYASSLRPTAGSGSTSRLTAITEPYHQSGARCSPQLEHLPTPDRKQDVASIGILTDHVQNGYKTLVVLDVDETIIATDIIHGKRQKVLIEAETPRVIREIRQKAPDSHIILLTKASKEETEVKLRKAGLNPNMFDSIESAYGTKGAALEQYINEKFQGTRHVCFIDDIRENLEYIESTCQKMNIHCNTFHFSGAETIQKRVNAFDFGMTPEQYEDFVKGQKAGFAMYN
ncbi:DUF2608 domain-containing protein [Endozoicomonas elysicola]|uniref:Uncharacterized protein n=1 Tax=Endozoicomonas elysicola TaxID=305900 RepID=A0A081KBK5_9GAMM|nr:DUF2608 domain-containing protein [Endozoicomonas elysicola]KEI71531.1 hypothetical protein GV64_12985 [Endozoicomonas elysicola]